MKIEKFNTRLTLILKYNNDETKRKNKIRKERKEVQKKEAGEKKKVQKMKKK